MNILYTLEHDVSLGDSLTNFHAHLSAVKYKYPYSNIYAVIHPRTYNTGVHVILMNKGLIDFVLPFPISNIDDPLNYHYNEVLKNVNFEFVIHTQHSSEVGIEKIVNFFPASVTHLAANELKNGFQNLFQFLEVNMDDSYLKILQESYNTNYVDKFVNDMLSLSTGMKSMGLFTNSTRPFANMTDEGVSRIIDCANDNNMFTYLLGTSKFNVYNPLIMNWEGTTNQIYGNSKNLIGTGWNKTLALMSKLDVIVTPPTGAAMIPATLHKNVILINGGDSTIMEDCMKVYAGKSLYTGIPCNCENYPCNTPELKNLERYMNCKSTVPKCLNQDLNIQALDSILTKI